MQKNKRITGILTALLLIFTLMLTACGEKANVSEEEVIARSKEELALFQSVMTVNVEKISADVDKRAIIYENVLMTVYGMPNVIITAKKIVGSGYDVASYEGKYGEKTSIAEMIYSDIEIHLDGFKIGSLAEYRIEGMELAYRDLLKTLRDNPDLDSKALLVKVAPYLSGYSAKLLLANDLRLDYEGMSAEIAKMEARDVSLGNYGPASLSGFQVSADGKQVMAIDKLGYTSLVLPEVYEKIAANPDETALMMIMFSIMQEPLTTLDKLDVKGFYLENFTLSPDTPPLNIARISGYLNIKNGVMQLSSNAQGFSLTQAFLNSENYTRVIAEAAKGQDLLFDSNYNMEVSRPEGGDKKTVVTYSMQDKQQGSISGDLTLSTKQDPDYHYDTQSYLHNLSFNTDDNGIMDVFLAMYAATNIYGTTNYSAFLQDFLAQGHALKAEISNPALVEALDNLLVTLQNGGKYQLVLKPASPLDIDDMESAISGPADSLGLSSTYTAPATPKKR